MITKEKIHTRDSIAPRGISEISTCISAHLVVSLFECAIVKTFQVFA